jgi:hypothetical protein
MERLAVHRSRRSAERAACRALRTRKSAQRRNAGAAGLVLYLAASTNRIADELAQHVAAEISCETEKWSRTMGSANFIAVYTALRVRTSALGTGRPHHHQEKFNPGIGR